MKDRSLTFAAPTCGERCRQNTPENAFPQVRTILPGDAGWGGPVSPLLGSVQATRAHVYVTGNHDYHTEAQGWVDLMDALGWEPLRNRHLLLERGGDTLVVAGVDDVTAESSGLAGHRAHLAGALRGADPELPVLLLAHQPAFVDRAAAEGVDLQISGHTHGGQIWPFHYPVRLDQPALAGLSHHGARTLLHTSRGAGFWGPPFRVFALSEITLLVLRSPRQPASS
ncbi:metallophosphoesterase [Streptomyces sp. NBC_01460]|uniref:metallophosphoesterase n=1 Tax=Streptomyces sp. NBC_01460 TaxID=2903875 RepID=UPI002E300C88|nr:metallophosphoesterase [Streptomyces sp. NBC_01460]